MGRPYYAYDWRFADFALGSPNGEPANQDYNGATAWTEPILPGSDHMMYVEHNVFNWDTTGGPPSGTAQGALYGSGGGRCVFRYNTLNGNDGAIDAHGDYPGYSTVYYEIYNNTFNVGAQLPQGESAWQRGGQWIVHDNTFVGGGTARIKLSIYHTYDNAAHWPKNSYFWGNVASGDTDQSHIVALKDSGQPGAYALTLANVRLDHEYFLHAPTTGQIYYPYNALTNPHPLTFL